MQNVKIIYHAQQTMTRDFTCSVSELYLLICNILMYSYYHNKSGDFVTIVLRGCVYTVV